VEAATLVAALLLGSAGLSGWELAAYAWWAAFALSLSFVDIAVHRLPNRLVVTAAVGFLSLLLPLAIAGRHGQWLRAVACGMALAAIVAVLAVVPSSGLGLGDAKFALTAGAASGWVSVFAVVATFFFAFAGLAVLGVTLIALRRADRRTLIPFGPFLATAALVSVVVLV